MLANRWAILALLFAVRAGMGYQFQSIPALAPELMSANALNLADIGLLIGLYQAPGIALALPGGALAHRFGDKRMVLVGLAIMTLGGLITALAQNWTMSFSGRLTAGVGGIVINVVMSKMVADWFAGKELATAMALFVNSWPVGIALAMIVLPNLAEHGGLLPPLLTVAAYPLCAFLGLALLYPKMGAAGPSSARQWPTGKALVATAMAGLTWGLYNVGMGTVLGFAALTLHERGWSSVAASATASIVLWLVAVSVPLGGLLADRSGRSGLVLLGGLAGFAVILVALTRTDAVVPALVAAGLLGGLAAGPIMGLAPSVLPKDARATGMGLFFTIFYALQLAGPWVIGVAARMQGSAAIALDLGAVALCAACLAYFAFRAAARP